MYFRAKETAILITGESCSSPCITAAAAGFEQGITEAVKVQYPFPKWLCSPSQRPSHYHHFSSASRARSKWWLTLPRFTSRALSFYTTFRACRGPITLICHSVQALWDPPGKMSLPSPVTDSFQHVCACGKGRIRLWMNGCVYKKHAHFYLRTEHLQLAIPPKETPYRGVE